MKDLRIQTYLRRLSRRLWIQGLADQETMAEIESHLLEALESGLQQGLSPEEAGKRALENFGSVKDVSAMFEKERNPMMQGILLVIAVLAGLFFAYVDSRPTWDDTGILAGAILLTCGLISLLGFRRPWLLALAVGAWIPLRGSLVTHNFGSVLALIIAFVGAYGGWLFRLGIRKTRHLV
jgi:HAAS domain-containing protein